MHDSKILHNERKTFLEEVKTSIFVKDLFCRLIHTFSFNCFDILSMYGATDDKWGQNSHFADVLASRKCEI